MKCFLAATLFFATHALEMSTGPCPTIEPVFSLEEFNAKELAGLWFEYAYPDDFREGVNYDCGSWTVLTDDAQKFMVYNMF